MNNISKILTVAIGMLLAMPALSGECVSAPVREAVLMPDGSQFEAGTLRICSLTEFTPGTVVYQASVDGRAYRMFFGREERQDAAPVTDARAYFVFRRAFGGTLELEAFAYPASNGDRYVTARSIGKTRVVANHRFARVRGEKVPAETIIVAAVAH